jgi:hypothetical protein
MITDLEEQTIIYNHIIYNPNIKNKSAGLKITVWYLILYKEI